MRYDVIGTPKAEEDLADIWLRTRYQILPASHVVFTACNRYTASRASEASG